MENKFQNGDKVRYVKEAPEDCGMTIKLNEFIGTYQDDIIISNEHRIPLNGVCDITDCFEKIN